MFEYFSSNPAPLSNVLAPATTDYEYNNLSGWFKFIAILVILIIVIIYFSANNLVFQMPLSAALKHKLAI